MESLKHPIPGTTKSQKDTLVLLAERVSLSTITAQQEVAFTRK